MKEQLKKITDLSSSEKLWRICPQPQNTCPMIDDLLEDLQNLIKSSQESLRELRQLTIEHDCPVCHTRCQDFLKEIHDHRVLQLEEQINDLKHLFLELENFRDACLEIRELGQAQKNRIWAFLNASLEIQEKNKTFKVKTHSLVKIKAHLVKKFNLINALKRFGKKRTSFKSYECECTQFQKKVLRQLNQTKLDIKFQHPDLFGEILNNYQKISFWTLELFKLSDTKILGIVRDQLVKHNFKSSL